MFGYVPGGYARILDRFKHAIEAEGVRIELGKTVSEVERIGEEIELRFVQGEPERFDNVVVTLAAPLAAKVCRGLTDEEYRRLNGVRYQGIVCASLLLRNPLSGFYVTNLLDDGIPFTGVIETSAMVDRRHFNGNALVYLPKYIPVDDPFFAVPDAEVEDLFLAGLERIHPNFSRRDVLCFRISRVRYVCPLSTLNYSARVPEMKCSVPGLYLVNSSQILNGTLNVNETVQLAERAAKMFGEQTGR
jgi:protoporphyrinogen oxidase